MPNYRLFRLPLNPERIDAVREHFDHLDERREAFERGLALENMNAEAAWLDEDAPALYYLHEEGDDYPADIEPEDINDPAVLELSQTHHGFFEEVAAEGHDHPDDLEELPSLFAASARD
ncbi:MAG: hypothetical protein ABEJ88_09440 [Halobacterium sp.]